MRKIIFLKTSLKLVFLGILTGHLEKNKLKIANAYPLFHTRILGPPLEAAFQIVRQDFGDRCDKINEKGGITIS